MIIFLSSEYGFWLNLNNSLRGANIIKFKYEKNDKIRARGNHFFIFVLFFLLIYLLYSEKNPSRSSNLSHIWNFYIFTNTISKSPQLLFLYEHSIFDKFAPYSFY